MWADVIRDAITRRLCVELEYPGFIRVVEPHVLGRDATGRLVMRVWQVRGGATRDETLGWKLLALGEIEKALVIGEQAYAPRIGYRRPDVDIVEVLCRI